MVASGGNGKRWQRGEGMLRGRDGGRAERAVPRRGTIVVSPTQLVPEVLAVWGNGHKSGKRVVDTRLW